VSKIPGPMAVRKKLSKRLHRERRQTDRSLKSERTATDRSLTRRSKSAQSAADAVRREIRSEADRGLAGQRKSADAERSRQSSSKKPASREIENERRSASTSLTRERRGADQILARQRRRSDSVLADERGLRRRTERILFDRERKRTDQDLGSERNRTDSAFVAAERRLGLAMTASEKAAAGVLLRDEFMAIISHDLRTPLSVIAINAARLAKMVPGGEGAEQIRKMCQQIEETAGRVGRMVDDLLDAERMALAKLRLPARPRDLRDVAREAIELVAPLVEAQGISLAAAIPENPVVTSFDRDRMLQVFSNLLANAVKFTPKGGMVQLAMKANDGLVRVSVSDTGPGIPAEQHERVFRRFTQFGRGGGGVGLGLYIARRIVEAHGGQIGLVSRPGEGSTFFFTLPQVQEKRVRKGGGVSRN
jgi:signal transduction histidine kinase